MTVEAAGAGLRTIGPPEATGAAGDGALEIPEPLELLPAAARSLALAALRRSTVESPVGG
ncbi:hypothetical protein [Polaromonas sp.]|uniref:hypothetical protein n=1 Tax=Polaromonas sp. TaxID=1869339 RepID=UPI00352B0334